MEIVIPVMSEQALSPRAADIIRAIVDSEFPDHVVKFKAWEPGNSKVLVFGKPTITGANNMQFVYTYSIAQIMSKANAASVLSSGIRQFISEPEAIPFRGPMGTINPQAILDMLDPTKPTAIDIETDGLLGKEQTPEEVNVISIAFYQEGHKPIVLVSRTPFDSFGRTGQLPKNDKTKQLLTQFTKAIYHNGKFDIRVLNRYFDIELVNWFDTMLAHHVLNHAAGDHKLKTLARRYLGAPEWEADLGKYTKGGGHYELIPYSELINYNGYDVYWTYKLWQFLAPQIEADENNEKAFLFEMSMAEFFLGVEQYGIPYDGHYAAKFLVEVETEMKDELWTLQHKLGLTGFNPNSPRQIKKILGDYGYTVADTLAETLQALMDDEDTSPGVKLILKHHLAYKKLSKIRGTYINGWWNSARSTKGGRLAVHPTFLIHGTTTGRLSSTQPNAQNMPRDKKIRGLIRTHG